MKNSTKSTQNDIGRGFLIAAGIVCAVIGYFASDAEHTKIALLVLALLFLIWPRSLPGRLGLSAPQRTMLLGALAIVMFVIGVRDDARKFVGEREIRVWNVYHYYLGAKYFPELGYTDLYPATLAADRESEGYWDKSITKVRDLTSYEVVRRREIEQAFDPAEAFTPVRWEEFKQDVHALTEYRSPKAWRGIFRDRGYNGTPFWTVVGQGLTRWIPADSAGLLVLCSLDWLLLGVTIWMVARTFGVSNTILVLLLFVASPTNVSRLVGGFLQVDWLCAIICSICFYRQRRPGVSGALMAYAVMTRAFPIVFVAGAILAVIPKVIRTHRVSRRFMIYLLAIGGFCALGFIISLGNGRGFQAWPEFREAISVHRDHHVLGDRRIGLEHIFTRDLSEFAREIDDDERQELLDSQFVFYLGSALLLIGLYVAAAYRSRSWNAQLLSLVLVFVLLVLSRYYYGLLALMPLLTMHERSKRWIVTGGQIAVFAGYYFSELQGGDRHANYTLLNVLLSIYFVIVLGAIVRGRSSIDVQTGRR